MTGTAGVEKFGPPSSGVTSMGVAAARIAPDRSRLTSLNGPEPTGLLPNGSVGSWSGDTCESRWAGAIGWVAASRKPPSGVDSASCTVSGSITVAVTSRHDSAPGPV